MFSFMLAYFCFFRFLFFGSFVSPTEIIWPNQLNVMNSQEKQILYDSTSYVYELQTLHSEKSLAARLYSLSSGRAQSPENTQLI